MPHSLARFLNLNERPPHPNLQNQQNHSNAVQEAPTIITIRGENFQNTIDPVADMGNAMASVADYE